MRIFFIVLFVSGTILCACRNETGSTTNITDSTTKNEYVAKDTPKLSSPADSTKKITPEVIDLLKTDSNTYSFSISGEEISTEGNNGIAYYDEDGKIKKITLDVYGEMRKINISYSFQKDSTILLREEDFSYPEGIDSVQKKGGIILESDTTVLINYAGNKIHSKNGDKDIGVFFLPYIKNGIPFRIDK